MVAQLSINTTPTVDPKIYFSVHSSPHTFVSPILMLLSTHVWLGLLFGLLQIIKQEFFYKFVITRMCLMCPGNPSLDFSTLVIFRNI
jgi:hypothetical protein